MPEIQPMQFGEQLSLNIPHEDPRLAQASWVNPNRNERAGLSYDQDHLRAKYHANRDVPAHMLPASPGDTHTLLPSPAPHGMQYQEHEIGVRRGDDTHLPNYEHPTERRNGKHVTGQLVMPAPGDEPKRSMFKRQPTSELDKHGNVYDARATPMYGTYSQVHGYHQAHIWNTHSQTQMVRADAVLHTGQADHETGSHSYITGPVDPEKPVSDILIKDHVPFIMDGHHRLAEVRGRGHEEFQARVMNLDQFKEQHGFDPFVEGHRARPRAAGRPNPMVEAAQRRIGTW